MIFSATPNITPEITHYETPDAEILKKFIHTQRKLIKQKYEDERLNGTSDVMSTGLLVLDDILDVSVIRMPSMRMLIFNGRSYHTNLILTAQYPLGIPPALRSNFDYIFMFRDDLIENRRRLYEHYAGMFPSFEAFSQVIDQFTGDFKCLVIDNTARSSKIEDMVFWYKAEI